MTLVPMNVEQLRRQAIKNSQLKEEQQKNYQAKLDQCLNTMSVVIWTLDK